MRPERLRLPDYLAGLSGVLLFASLFAPWYTVDDGTVDGWRSLGLIDLWLGLTALLAIAVPVVTATRDAPALPVAVDVLTTWAASLAAVLVLFRLLFVAGGEAVTGRSWGVVVAAVAVAGTLAGAYWAMRKQDAPGLRPPPEVRAMPTPPERDPALPPT